MRKNLRQSILRSFGRYIAISAIIALGAGLFLGLLMTKTDMVATGQSYITRQRMFDLRMVSNYGWPVEYVEKFAALEGVEQAEGLIYMDYIAQAGEEDDAVYRFYAIPETLNLLSLRGGRMPQTQTEILIDGYNMEDSILGTKVVLSPTNDDEDLESIRYREFTVVGYISTPLYMDMNRGTTAIGSGSLSNCFYLPREAFDVEVYSEIDLTIPGEHEIYTKAYSDALDAAVDLLEPEAERLAQQRYDELLAEIEEEYQEGYQEYLDGLKEYEDGKAEAEEELADALQELQDGEKEVADGRADLVKAEQQIQDGQKAIDEGWYQWNLAVAEFEATKAEAEVQLNAARAELDAQAPAVYAGYEQAMAGIQAAQEALAQAEAATNAQTVFAEIQALEAQRAALEADETKAEELAQIDGQIAAKQAQLEPYWQAKAYLDAANAQSQQVIQAKASIDQGYATLREQEAQIEAGAAQLEAARLSLDENQITLEHARSRLNIGWGEWREGKEELEEGWTEYYDAKAEVEQELADAEDELREAEEELADARKEIDDMEPSDLMILDRESNVGYNNLDSSSDIVSGVSRVFPVFFLLIASLVCITTMTRMIDEERTQIGTLKALGYSNGAIISKYLIYSGSSAVLGCTLGILAGSTIFPKIIWEAYSIMLYIQPDIVLTLDWPLAIGIVASYLAVMLLVTWYCCARTLKEEPAELIRPKAPDPGKKIFLEKLPIWHKLSFLNIVAIRNIFRYRQRLAMMLIGIGGCTALLIAGFGLRDSIVNVVDYQFDTVTYYDLSVYFRHALDEAQQAEFEEVISGKTEHFLYYHQSSVEMDAHNKTKELYMIVGEEELTTFIDLHKDTEKLDFPGLDQVVLSSGVSENMGISVGDTVTLRNGDMQQMELTVSGIYDNHVYNYALVAPETLEKHWGEKPELQMAFIIAAQGQDVHTLSAAVTDLSTVMNVSVSEDLAGMVSNMMKALDLVVMVVVFCAGLLAVIVLYNLTNININERIREIATIKVLGFNAKETASYVFKENLVLTVVGSFLGLGLGRLLLEFIMSQIKIDMVWFKPMLSGVSCVLSVALTLLSAVAVVFIFYFKLEKINMAEALKSVE